MSDSSYLSDDVTFIKDPSPWYTLDNLTQATSSGTKVLLCSSAKRKFVGIILDTKRKEKAAMQDWQGALIKRRKASIIEQSPESTLVAESPSTPSMTVSRESVKGAMITKSTVLLRPISNLKFPPRPAGGLVASGKPRLKLEPSKEGSTRMHRAKGFSGEFSRDSAHQKPRTVSLEERFQLQIEASREKPNTKGKDSISSSGPSSASNFGSDCILPKKSSSNKPLSKVIRVCPDKGSAVFDWQAWGSKG